MMEIKNYNDIQNMVRQLATEQGGLSRLSLKTGVPTPTLSTIMYDNRTCDIKLSTLIAIVKPFGELHFVNNLHFDKKNKELL